MMMPLEFINFINNLSHLLMWDYSFFVTEHTFWSLPSGMVLGTGW